MHAPMAEVQKLAEGRESQLDGMQALLPRSPHPHLRMQPRVHPMTPPRVKDSVQAQKQQMPAVARQQPLGLTSSMVQATDWTLQDLTARPWVDHTWLDMPQM